MKQSKEKTGSAYLHSYEIIRDRILNGDYPSGMKIVEERLAEELGVSRTPVRESIHKLELEGLIEKKRVVQPSEKDLRNIFQMRILLEGYSAKCAASYLLEDDLAALWDCIQIGRSGTNEEIMNANERFHDIIVNASRNSYMISTIDKMKSIKARDGQLADQLMQEHLQNDLDFCLHLLSDN